LEKNIFKNRKNKGGDQVKEKVKLPIVNENGYYEIRLESIGGLGANLCGKMLGELGLQYLGLNSASFSSYGSEKTGTPVKGFIRYSAADQDIRLHSPIKEPHLLTVFHDALLTDASVLDGCSENTDLIINTMDHGEDGKDSRITEKVLQNVYKLHGIFCVDAQKIAIETKSRVNVVMLGAMAKVMGFIKPEYLYDICEKVLGKKYPAALAGNLEGIRRGYEEVHPAVHGAGEKARKEICGKKNLQSGREESVLEKDQDIPSWGYETAPAGGINPCYGNSVVNDLSPSRQGYFPIFIPERCINCGLCDTTCPDMVFQFQKGEFKGREMMINKGLDYYHCKGCLRCVDVCPVQALVSGVEAEHPDKQYFLPNQQLQRSPIYYEKAGPDGYITSESYLTERRMKGGEV